MKISKFKNTGLIFELLSMQMVQDVLTKGKSPAYNIIKKYYKAESEIGKEYALYKLFHSDKAITESAATRMINLAILERRKIDESKLLRQKYNLIKEIKESYNITEFFGQKIKKYRLHGALFGLFENVNANLTQKIVYQDQIIEQVTAAKPKPIVESSMFDGLDADTKKLVYKLIIEKFNSKYDDLNKKQKTLLSKYINENQSGTKFKSYMLTEVDSVSKSLKVLEAKIPNDRLKIKLKEVDTLLETIIKSRQIKDEHVSSLLKYYELINILGEHAK